MILALTPLSLQRLLLLLLFYFLIVAVHFSLLSSYMLMKVVEESNLFNSAVKDIDMYFFHCFLVSGGD